MMNGEINQGIKSKKMRYSLIFLSLLFCQIAYSQLIENCGLNNSPLLTKDESDFLNDYLKDQRGAFDFSEKKIIFVTGNSGGTIGTKGKYFQNVKEWSESYDRTISTDLIVFNDKEINDSGHHAILTYWVKVMPKNTKKKIIKRMMEKPKGTG